MNTEDKEAFVQLMSFITDLNKTAASFDAVSILQMASKTSLSATDVLLYLKLLQDFAGEAAVAMTTDEIDYSEPGSTAGFITKELCNLAYYYERWE